MSDEVPSGWSIPTADLIISEITKVQSVPENAEAIVRQSRSVKLKRSPAARALTMVNGNGAVPRLETGPGARNLPCGTVMFEELIHTAGKGHGRGFMAFAWQM
jgi:hypothetical protein